MQRSILLLIAFVLLAGCATNTAPAPPTVTMAPGQAGLVITRSRSLLYAGAAASVDLNGARIANLNVGQSYTGPIAPGNLTLSVSAWSAPGASSLNFTALSGQTYRFVVGPRGEGMLAGIAGGVIGQAAEGGGPFSIAAVGQ